MKYPAGKDSVVKIGDQIHLGAKVFMLAEYKILAPVVLALVLACGFSPLGWYTAVAILVGALSSAIAGFIGMYSATKANVRTASARLKVMANKKLYLYLFLVAQSWGLCVASMGLVGLGGLYLFFTGAMDDPDKIAKSLEGFGVGASAVALFSRVGGGIYTKSADVGADLVGKIEAGIPEDDPRNPGVIADNVGDNVGIAGMGSDIFESYCGAMIASMAIAATFGNTDLMFLPLWLAAAGLFCSLLGIFIVRTQVSQSPAVALRFGTFFAPIIFLIIAGLSIYYSPNIELSVFYSVLTGAVGGILIGLTIFEYYTGGSTEDSPVGKIAKSGETGPATVMITGLSVGMQSVVLPLFVIAAIIGISTHFSGLYGVGIAAVGMLCTAHVGIYNGH